MREIASLATRLNWLPLAMTSLAFLILVGLAGQGENRPFKAHPTFATRQLPLHFQARLGHLLHQEHQVERPTIAKNHTAGAPGALPIGEVNCYKVACIALTFDDGPKAEVTPRVLAVLEQAQIPATFFLIGIHIAGNEALLQRMHADGDEIGNHTWSHADLTKLSPAEVKQQIFLTQKAIMEAGVPPPTVFRPPYGFVNQTVRANVPMSILFWNEDPKDWALNTPQEVIRAVESAARPGGIVEMHDVYNNTADALPTIINDLKNQQYHFVTVSQLLNLSPSTRGDFYGHH